MAISLNREGNLDGTIDLSISIATTKFYNNYWEKAIKDVGVKIFRENGEFNKNNLYEVMDELERLKEWAYLNLSGKELDYMKERIIDLIEGIPQMFDKEDVILYIY